MTGADTEVMTPDDQAVFRARVVAEQAEAIKKGAAERKASGKTLAEAAGIREDRAPALRSSGTAAIDRRILTIEAPRDLLPIELGALIESDIPEPKAICGPLLREGNLGMVYGPAGTGKTFFLLGLAVSVAYREPFLTFPVSEPRSVLYVDGEMRAFEMQARSRQLAGRLRETTDHLFAPLRIVTPDLQPRGIPKIDTIEGQEALLRLADAQPDLALIIFDNLSCLTNPEDDNSSSSWSAVQDLLLALRRRGIAAILGHHAGKGGQQRGTSRRADILDLILKLSPIADGVVDGRTRVSCEFEKARGLTPDLKQPFTATLEPHPDGGLMWTKALAEALEDRTGALDARDRYAAR